MDTFLAFYKVGLFLLPDSNPSGLLFQFKHVVKLCNLSPFITCVYIKYIYIHVIWLPYPERHIFC